MSSTEDRYFKWLVDQLNDKNHDPEEYSELLSFLHTVDFYYSVWFDENRLKDGEALRWHYIVDSKADYIDEMEFNNQYGSLPVTVLEVLVALSRKIGLDLMYDPQYEYNIGYWFWKMLKNIGIGWMSNDIFDMNEAMVKVHLFLDRRYKRDGSGGIFTIKNPKIDMRKEELWKQVNHYLNEN